MRQKVFHSAADSALQELELVDGLADNLLFAWDEEDLPSLSAIGSELDLDADEDDEDSDNGKDQD